MKVKGREHDGYARPVEFNCPDCGYHFLCSEATCSELKRARTGMKRVTRAGIGAAIGAVVAGPLGGLLGAAVADNSGYTFHHSCQCGSEFDVRVGP